MRIGIAGVGRIGALHAANLAALGEVQVVLADVDRARAEQVAEQVCAGASGGAPGVAGAAGAPTEAGAVVEVAAGVDALFAAATALDAVVIASSTDTHAALLRRALTAGLPVFCEKPVSQSLTETIELAALERDRGAYAHIGFQRRFDAAYRRAHDAIAAGELGMVHSIRAATLDNSPPPASYIAVSGGIFADCCIHDFDVIRYLSGAEAVAAYAAGGAVGPTYITELNDAPTVAGVLTLDDGSLASFAGSRVNGYGHDVRTEIHGTTGDLAVGLFEETPLRSAENGIGYPGGAPVQGFIDRFRPAYATELAAFVEAVRARTQRGDSGAGAARVASPCSVRDGLEALRIAVACETSRREGRVVPLAEIPGLPEPAGSIEPEPAGPIVPAAAGGAS